MIVNWKSDLFKEKSLHEVFRASKTLPKSPHNKFLYAVSGIATSLALMVWLTNEQVAESAKAAMVAAEIAFDLSVQILGFLIGGFAIFATVTDDRLMIRLAQAPMEKSDLSVFKHVFFNFLSVFYIYIATLACGVLVKIGNEVDVVDPRTVMQWRHGATALTLINCSVFAVLAWMITLATVRLKSFIWNIYQGFITFLAVSDMMTTSDRDRDQSG